MTKRFNCQPKSLIRRMRIHTGGSCIDTIVATSAISNCMTSDPQSVHGDLQEQEASNVTSTRHMQQPIKPNLNLHI